MTGSSMVEPGPLAGSVVSMVSAQAARQPNALAVASPQGTLTYGELNSRATALAARLRDLGVDDEAVVGLWLTRSPHLIVSALAVLKAGGAFLPLDPSLPDERLRLMLCDSGAALALVESSTAEAARAVGCPLLNLDEEILVAAPAERSDAECAPERLAYVIYTSGSTGTPKGVEITHGNLASLVRWHNRAFAVTANDRASHLAGLAFDASIWEIWPYLAAGASLHLVPSDLLINPEQLIGWFAENQITIGFVPTPIAERLLVADWPSNSTLRMMLTGGDTLHLYPSPSLPFQLVNNYGPTECTVVSTSTVLPARAANGELPPIGSAVDDARVYILDEQLHPVQPGETGEIYVAGAIVGRGYRHRPDLTAERFLADPFAQGRMYKTGDLGREMPDGKIAFLGRSDSQVKIRGYRIEPEEIVANLRQHPAVNAAAVIAMGQGVEEKRLVGYVVLREAAARSDVQQFLLARLPEYMVPATFVRLESLPLTANGKVDRAALPEPTAENSLRDEIADPRSEIEASVAQIVATLLKVSAVGPDDNFFLLGGHSLLGTQLITRVRDAFDVNVRLRSLFEHPTVRGLAGEIERLLLAKLEEMSEEQARSALGNPDRNSHSEAA